MNKSAKISVAFGAFTAIVLGGSAVVAFFLGGAQVAVREITDHAEPLNAATYEMEINVVETGLAVMQYLRQQDAAIKELLGDDRRASWRRSANAGTWRERPRNSSSPTKSSGPTASSPKWARG